MDRIDELTQIGQEIAKMRTHLQEFSDDLASLREDLAQAEADASNAPNAASTNARRAKPCKS